MTDKAIIERRTPNAERRTPNAEPSTFLADSITIPYEQFEPERLDPIYDVVAPYSVMSRNDRYFLSGIVRAHKPHKILEAGVAHGGGSAIILNAISNIEGAKLYSVDYLEQSFRFPDKPSGFIVEERFPQFLDKFGAEMSHASLRRSAGELNCSCWTLFTLTRGRR